MYGARRADMPVTTTNTLALLERRCLFLEEQDKRRIAEVADLRVKLAEAHLETVHAVTLLKTVQVVDVDAIATSSTAEVDAGLKVQLQYPMKRVRSADDTYQVWMRRREVDPDLASVTYSWLLLFEEKEGTPDKVLVGNFC